MGCINGIAEIIVENFKQSHPDLGTFDSITILKHPYGCSQLGQDHQNTRQILIDAVQHPNAGGVLVFGLGCENNTVAEFKEKLGDYDTDRVKFLVAQESQDEIEAGEALLHELLQATKDDRREDVPLSELKVGLKMRRLRWIFWYHCQPIIRSIFRFLGFSRWQHCVDGSTGNVWCRASIDVSCQRPSNF